MIDSIQTVHCLVDTVKVTFSDCTICNHSESSLLNLNWSEATVFICFFVSVLGCFATYKYFKNEKLRHDKTFSEEKKEETRKLNEETSKNTKLEKENKKLKEDIDELLFLVRKAFVARTGDEKISEVLDFEKKYYNLLKDYGTFKNRNNNEHK